MPVASTVRGQRMMEVAGGDSCCSAVDGARLLFLGAGVLLNVCAPQLHSPCFSIPEAFWKHSLT